MSGLDISLYPWVPQVRGGFDLYSGVFRGPRYDDGASRNLLPLATVTRASVGTYLGNDGVLKSAANNVARYEYDSSGNLLGLLVEEAGTNLIDQSEEFDHAVAWVKTNTTVTADVTTAPDGTLSADKLVETAVSATHRVANAGAMAAGATVGSVYAKQAERGYIKLFLFNPTDGILSNTFFDIATGVVVSGPGLIEPIGNGWFRCSVSATTTAINSTLFIGISPDGSTEAYLGDITKGVYLWGGDVKLGATISSYVKTTTAAATRAADDPTLTLGSWFNALEGSLLVAGDFSGSPDGVNAVAATIHDGTFDQRIDFAKVTADLMGFLVNDGGVLQANLNGTAKTQGDTFRMACAWKANDFAKSVEGGAVQTDGAGTVPTVTDVSLGKRISGGYLNGHLEVCRYYPTRLPDARLEALSA